MASTAESGHAKNVSNFQVLIEFVTGYGATYNPSKNILKLPQLLTLKSTAEEALSDVLKKNTNYNTKVNERSESFSGLKGLSTRLVNALATTEASTATMNDAKGFNRKMQGKRASSTQSPIDPQAEAPKSISTSQQSYDQLIEHLAGLKSVLEQEASYTPNETDLQVATVQATIAKLKLKNKEVAKAYTSVSNARISRDEVLYQSENSIAETAAEVKKYVKSVFGATSPQFKQISGIKFTKK
jgi:hypothetical protein